MKLAGWGRGRDNVSMDYKGSYVPTISEAAGQ